jgi:hypothetical protein
MQTHGADPGGPTEGNIPYNQKFCGRCDCSSRVCALLWAQFIRFVLRGCLLIEAHPRADLSVSQVSRSESRAQERNVAGALCVGVRARGVEPREPSCSAALLPPAIMHMHGEEAEGGAIASIPLHNRFVSRSSPSSSPSSSSASWCCWYAVYPFGCGWFLSDRGHTLHWTCEGTCSVGLSFLQQPVDLAGPC